MQQITDAMITAMDKMITEGVIEKMLTEQLEKTIVGALESAFKTYSPFGKALSAHIESALQVDFQHLHLERYHDFILKFIQGQLAANLTATAEKHLGERLSELLQPPPAEITLSSVVAQFIEYVSVDHRRDDDSEEIALFVEHTNYGFSHIYMDVKSDERQHGCRYQLDVKDGHVYSVKIDGDTPHNQIFLGPLYSFERTLFGLYMAKTKLIFDCDADSIDRSLPAHECHC